MRQAKARDDSEYMAVRQPMECRADCRGSTMPLVEVDGPLGDASIAIEDTVKMVNLAMREGKRYSCSHFGGEGICRKNQNGGTTRL